MGHTDPAALPSASPEELKKDHDGKTPKLDAEGHPLCPICETPCVASGLTWSCPTHTELVFAIIDTPVSNETVEIRAPSTECFLTAASTASCAVSVAGVEIKTDGAADSARFTAHPNGIVVRANDAEQGGGFSAWVGTISSTTSTEVVPGCFPEIPAVGTGSTEAEAVLSLAGLLAEFVRGHAKRIVELEAALQAEHDMVGEKLP